LARAFVLVAVVAFVTVSIIHVRAADRDARVAQTLLRQLGPSPAPTTLTSPRDVALLDRAHQYFVAAEAELGNPALRVVGHLPMLGTQVRAARDQAAASAQLTATASDVLVRTRLLTKAAIAPTRAGLVAQLHSISSFARRETGSLNGLHVGQADGLMAPLAASRRQLVATTVLLTRYLAASSHLSDTLISLTRTPKHYLVLVPTAGQRLTAIGTITTSTGAFRPLPLTSRVSAAAPDASTFPATSHLLAIAVLAATGRPVDGAIAIDAAGFSGVLKTTGGWQLDGSVFTSADLTPGHLKVALAKVALVDPALASMLGGLETHHESLPKGQGLLTRHILVWSVDQSAQKAFAAAGLAGTRPA
jgi:hypothetical protein